MRKLSPERIKTIATALEIPKLNETMRQTYAFGDLFCTDFFRSPAMYVAGETTLSDFTAQLNGQDFIRLLQEATNNSNLAIKTVTTMIDDKLASGLRRKLIISLTAAEIGAITDRFSTSPEYLEAQRYTSTLQQWNTADLDAKKDVIKYLLQSTGSMLGALRKTNPNELKTLFSLEDTRELSVAVYNTLIENAFSITRENKEAVYTALSFTPNTEEGATLEKREQLLDAVTTSKDIKKHYKPSDALNQKLIQLRIAKEWIKQSIENPRDIENLDNLIDAVEKYYSQTRADTANNLIFAKLAKNLPELLYQQALPVMPKLDERVEKIYSHAGELFYSITAELILDRKQPPIINLGKCRSEFKITQNGYELVNIEYENADIADLFESNDPNKETQKQYDLLKNAFMRHDEKYKNSDTDRTESRQANLNLLIEFAQKHALPLDLSRLDFSGLHFSKFNFKGVNLDRCNFEGATLESCEFEGALSLMTVNFVGAKFLDIQPESAQTKTLDEISQLLVTAKHKRTDKKTLENEFIDYKTNGQDERALHYGLKTHQFTFSSNITFERFQIEYDAIAGIKRDENGKSTNLFRIDFLKAIENRADLSSDQKLMLVYAHLNDKNHVRTTKALDQAYLKHATIEINFDDNLIIKPTLWDVKFALSKITGKPNLGAYEIRRLIDRAEKYPHSDDAKNWKQAQYNLLKEKLLGNCFYDHAKYITTLFGIADRLGIPRDLSHLNLSGAKLEGIDLTGCTLTETVLPPETVLPSPRRTSSSSFFKESPPDADTGSDKAATPDDQQP